ncbi:hypothetical protein DAI22_08g156500 [Oryza sativa Japonica Group]|nr:hypothetical protein DAI22_08g156500 [Oryza sativa Japonica Group]
MEGRGAEERRLTGSGRPHHRPRRSPDTVARSPPPASSTPLPPAAAPRPPASGRPPPLLARGEVADLAARKVLKVEITTIPGSEGGDPHHPRRSELLRRPRCPSDRAAPPPGDRCTAPRPRHRRLCRGSSVCDAAPPRLLRAALPHATAAPLPVRDAAASATAPPPAPLPARDAAASAAAPPPGDPAAPRSTTARHPSSSSPLEEQKRV